MAELQLRKITLGICKAGRNDPLQEIAPSLPANTLAVSTDKSAKELQRMGLDMERLIWVDATGKIYWRAAPQKDFSNWFFTEGPTALAHLSTVVAAKSAAGHVKFVALCKINPLLEQNGLEKTEDFLRYLALKFRSLGIGFLVIADDSAGVRRLRRSLPGVFDSKITLS